MRNRFTTVLSVALLAALSGAIVRAMAPAQEAPSKTPKAARVERGAYLVKTMGCNDCHTPLKMGPKGPEPDMTRALTGHPAEVVMPPPPPASGPWVGHMSATNTAWAGPW